MIASQVACDLEYPRPLMAVGVIRAIQGAQERFLCQILGGGTVAKEPPQEPIDRVPIPNEEVVDLGAVHVRSLVMETSQRRNPLTARLD